MTKQQKAVKAYQSVQEQKPQPRIIEVVGKPQMANKNFAEVLKNYL